MWIQMPNEQAGGDSGTEMRCHFYKSKKKPVLFWVTADTGIMNHNTIQV